MVIVSYWTTKAIDCDNECKPLDTRDQLLTCHVSAAFWWKQDGDCTESQNATFLRVQTRVASSVICGIRVNLKLTKMVADFIAIK